MYHDILLKRHTTPVTSVCTWPASYHLPKATGYLVARQYVSLSGQERHNLILLISCCCCFVPVASNWISACSWLICRPISRLISFVSLELTAKPAMVQLTDKYHLTLLLCYAGGLYLDPNQSTCHKPRPAPTGFFGRRRSDITAIEDVLYQQKLCFNKFMFQPLSELFSKRHI